MKTVTKITPSNSASFFTKTLLLGVSLSLCNLASADPTIAADGVNFGNADDDPLLRKGDGVSKDLELDMATGGAFSIYSGLDANATFRAGEGNEGTVIAGKWYRIAKSNDSGNQRTNALFSLRDITSGAHNNVTFRTGMSYGAKTKMSLTLLSNSAYNLPVFDEVRYLSSGIFDEFYLEVKIAKSAVVSYSIMENLAKGGWQPVDWVETTSIPAGYTDTKYDLKKLFIVAGETSILSVDRDTGVAIDGGLTVDGSSVLTAASSPYSLVHNGSQTAFLSEGSYVGGSATQIPAEGAGTRMMWYPEKAAFRVGRVTGDQWDESNVGAFSTATGLDNIASAWNSTANGHLNIASDNYAVAVGKENVASGWNSTARGWLNVSSGTYALATGKENIASEGYAIASGQENIASAWNATARGYLNEASGNYAVASGRENVASGWSATARGYNNHMSQYVGTAFGRFNEDRNNGNEAAETAWQGDNLHSIFEIGIGSDDANRENAMTIMQDGTIELGKDANTNEIPLKISSDGSVTLNGAVILNKVQGDISMGIYGQ